ncbi:hypothetical protein L0128_17715 [candidate division KSB1 bacterium]|nr:hypothetical protein [candidate division KSB1 bacterium]
MFKSVFLLSCLWMVTNLAAQHLELAANRVTGVHNGNLIRTRFTNYGNLGHRTEQPSMEWPKGSGLEYGQEFVMFAGARITDADMNQYYIFTESYSDPFNLDEDPTGTYTYSWEPLPGYFNTLLPEGQQTIALSNIRESWPRHWIYDYPGAPGSRDGMWNGEFKAAPIADQESYYVMVDWNNTESAYDPFPADRTKGGLGLQVKVRTYQWSDPLAEDILISIYDITNTSDTTLNNVVFGMYVDADVGGPLNDVMAFDPSGEINITYQWDKQSAATGFFGFAFLESPGIETDGFDNDEDGLIDESRASGRGVWIENDNSAYMLWRYNAPRRHWSGDEDGDWDPRYHDTGSDGLLPGEEDYPGPDTDGTEGNGVPDDGEPNFDRTDLDESDQIGLTSFTPAQVNRYKLKDDKVLYDRTVPGTYEVMPTSLNLPIIPKQRIDLGGNVEFVYGAGYFPLKPGQTERFSVAALFGHNETDILGNKAIMQRIYDDNYRFARPPIKPTLCAYPKDRQVILSWNSSAETSYDEIYGHDFEGYVLYRATDPEFNSIKTITDAYNNPFYYEPLAQFDLRDGLNGPHPISAGANISGVVDKNGKLIERIVRYPGNGAHFDMGQDTGLSHFYIDAEVENGRTYYYAIVAYDKGYDFDFYARGLSERNPKDGYKPIYPVQNSKTITQDVVGNIVFHDRNTAVVVPNTPAAGTELAQLDGLIGHTGPATGSIELVILLPDSLQAGHRYQLTFTDAGVRRQTKNYQIRDLTTNSLLIDRTYPAPYTPTSEIGAILTPPPERIESGSFHGLMLLLENHGPDQTLKANWRNFQGRLSNAQPIPPGKRLNPIAFLPPAGNYHLVDTGATPYYADVFTVVENACPATLQLVFADEILDTTLSALPEFRIPINFQAIDADDSTRLRVLTVSDLPHQSVQHGAEIVLLKRFSGQFYVIAQLRFTETNRESADAPYLLPQGGSKLEITPTEKNFTARDQYEFTIKAAYYDSGFAKQNLAKIAVVPDPYIASASWEKPLYFTSGRGERRVDFIHLPAVCTIRIFTLDGKLVCKLDHQNPIEDGHHSWDLTSKDGLEVAPGIYLFHVEAPGIGEKMGRFALIK